MGKLFIFVLGCVAGGVGVVIIQLFFAVCKEPLRTDKDGE